MESKMDDQELKEQVKNLAALHKSAVQLSLQFYHTLGALVTMLHSDVGPGNKKTKKIELLSRALQDKTGLVFRRTTLYQAMRFNARFTEDQMKTLVESGWSWRNVAFICTEQVPEKAAMDAVRRVAAKEIKQEKVRDQLKVELGLVRARSKSTVQAPAIGIKKLATTITQCHTRLEEVAEFQKRLRGLSKVERQALASDAETMVRSIRDLVKELGDLSTTVERLTK